MVTYRPSRRAFIAQVGTLAVAAGTAPMWFDMVNGTKSWALSETDTLPLGTPIVVHVALHGGNDHLNMLAPVGDSWYHDANVGHGAIALGTADTLALTGSDYRLHKNLAWLANRWNTVGDVGFAVGVGEMSDNSFSHFDQQRYWDTGRIVEKATTNTGWLGRYVDMVSPQNPLASVSMNDLLLDSISATAPTLVVSDCSTFGWTPAFLDSNLFLASAKKMATIGGTTPVADVARMLNTTFTVGDRVKGSYDANVLGTNPSQWSWITQQLMQTALLVRAGIPSQTYTLAVGMYDSHINQLSMQSARFNEMNEGLTHFFAALAGHPREKDVFVLITSEFGRQASVNKDNGTDHGQAGMAIFIGGGVNRGIFGDAPTLDPGGPTRPNRINDALKPTIDFRSVHATALNRLAKGDTNASHQVLGGTFEDLGVFTAGTIPATTTTAKAVTTTTAKAATTTTVKPTTTTTAKPAPTTTTKPNAKPAAVMTLSKQAGKVPFLVIADGSKSKDSDGSIANYSWSWGDGTGQTNGATVTHTFTKKGSFAVQLTVTDNKGATATTGKTVTVT